MARTYLVFGDIEGKLDALINSCPTAARPMTPEEGGAFLR